MQKRSKFVFQWRKTNATAILQVYMHKKRVKLLSLWLYQQGINIFTSQYQPESTRTDEYQLLFVVFQIKSICNKHELPYKTIRKCVTLFCFLFFLFPIIIIIIILSYSFFCPPFSLLVYLYGKISCNKCFCRLLSFRHMCGKLCSYCRNDTQQSCILICDHQTIILSNYQHFTNQSKQ